MNFFFEAKKFYPKIRLLKMFFVKWNVKNRKANPAKQTARDAFL